MSVEDLAAAHGRALRGLDAALARNLVTLWRMTGTLEHRDARSLLLDTVPDLTASLGTISAQISSDYYAAIRRDAGVPGSFAAQLAPPTSTEQARASVGWATAPMRAPDFDSQTTLVRLSGTARRLMRLPGRRTVMNALKEDPAAPRHLRVARPGACSFCTMLASRGAVYVSLESGDFQAHDHCKCFASPVFNETQITDQSRRLHDEWREVTRGTDGPKAARAAWRAHVEAPVQTG